MHQINVRKADFWRWASKKAYNRLVANGRLWGVAVEAGATAGTPRKEGSAVAGLDDDAVAEDTGYSIASGLEALNMSTTEDPSTRKPKNSSPSTKTPDFAAPRSQKKASIAYYGWMQIGKIANKAKPSIKLKMSGNGGLAKLQVTPKDRFDALDPLGPRYIQQ